MEIKQDSHLSFKNIIVLILFVVGIAAIVGTVFITSKKLSQNQITSRSMAAERAALLYQENFELGLGNWIITDPSNAKTSTSYSRGPSTSLVVQSPVGATATDANVVHRFATSQEYSKVFVFIYDRMDPADSDQAYAYFALTDDSGSKGISIGVKPSVSRTNYVYCPQHNNLDSCLDTGIARSEGWHRLKLFVTPKGSYGLVEDHNLSYLPGKNVNGTLFKAVNTDLTSFQKIKIGVEGSSFMRVYFDDLGIYSMETAPNSETEIIDIALGWFKSTYGGNITEESIRNLIVYYDQEYQDQQVNCQIPNPRPLDKPCPSQEDYNLYRGILIDALNDTAANLRRLGENNKAEMYERALSILPTSILPTSVPITSPPTTGLVCDKQFVGYFKPVNDWRIYQQGTVRTGFIANSWAEENAGVIVDNLLPSYLDCMSKPKTVENQNIAADLLIQLRLFAFHSLSRSESTSQISSPLATYPSFTSQTIYNGKTDPKRPNESNTNFMLDNHLFHPDPTYALVVPKYLSIAAFEFREKYGYVPNELKHNVTDVYKKALEYIDIKDFQYKGSKIVTRHEDANMNNLSESGPIFAPAGDVDQNLRYDFGLNRSYGMDERLWPNPYRDTGKGDWKDDALLNRISLYALMSKLYGFNEYRDVDTGFQTNNVVKHALDYIFYIHNGYLFAPHNSIELLTKEDLLIPGGTSDNHSVYTNTVIYSIVRNNAYVGDLLYAKRVLQAGTGLGNADQPTQQPNQILNVIPSAKPTATPTRNRVPTVTRTPTPRQPTLMPTRFIKNGWGCSNKCASPYAGGKYRSKYVCSAACGGNTNGQVSPN